MAEITELLAGCGEIVADYLAHTETLVTIALTQDCRILTYNGCAGRLLAAGGEVIGRNLEDFLLPESHGVVPLAAGGASRDVRLNFTSGARSVVPLQCRIARTASGYLILGGQLMLTNEQILQKMTLMSNEMANMTRELHRRNREVQEAQAKIKVLGGIIPICMHCKGIRDDKGYWNKLEEFITEHSEALFSHSICDKCVEKFYPELNMTDDE